MDKQTQTTETAIALPLTVTISGATRQHAEKLRAKGYRWDPRGVEWYRRVTDPAKAQQAAHSTGCAWSGCHRIVRDATGRVLCEHSAADLNKWTLAHCAACGDHVPCQRTPRGMLCADCAR